MGLRLERVSFGYRMGRQPVTPALADVTLSVERGELVVVVGATGSGKTTLMKVAAGLLQPESGSVLVDGAEPSAGRGSSGVGLIFQDAESQLFADTLLDDVAFGPRNQGMAAEEAAARAREALAAVGLEPDAFGTRSPFSLSGGEARRAAIAGVLSMQPAYVLADEPTAGLDAPGRRRVRSLLLQQRERAGLIVVTHAAEEFLPHADRLAVLDGGRLVWSGTAASAIAHPEELVALGQTLPDVLEVQRLAAQAGVVVPSYTMDAIEAADMLAAARGER